MAEQYWIGGFFIDLSRNQISQNQQSQTLAPKALAVLTYLAENQGKVVSQEALLDKVWQGTVVSPNTLQRSIAQLRKALGDDGKVQVYIKTHAKQGYSLECDVRWQEKIQSASPDIFQESSVAQKPVENTDNNQSSITKQEAPQTAKNYTTLALVFISLVIFTIGGYLISKPKPLKALSFGEMRALTATDHKEFGGIYSPDGKYVVFQRYTDLLCRNNIWAKNLETQQEFQLTDNIGTYSSQSFSKDGKQLVLIQTQDCSEPITQKKCYKLMSLDFEKALTSPQPLTELMECKNSVISKPTWLNNNNIALLQKDLARWKLLSYSVTENTSQTLYEPINGNIVYYSYSNKENLIALISERENDDHYINILDAEGKLLSSNKINYPKEVAKYRFVSANFSPLDEMLIFSTGRQLFTLSFTGQVSNISLPIDEPMSSPTFHPNGKRMVVIKGHYDADIVSMPYSAELQKTHQATPDYSVLERSTTGDYNAMVQPNGDAIAFKSKRSGEEQIWITSNSSSKQLSHFPKDTYIRGFDWAADGNSLLVNVHHQLIQVFLDGTTKQLSLAHPVVTLFQWHSATNNALVIVRINGLSKFAEIDLKNSQTRIIKDSQVSWALKTEQGQIIYTDQLDRFWQKGPIEDELIKPLRNQGSDKRFLVKDVNIYGINKNLQFWSYNIESKEINFISTVPDNLDHISDLDDLSLYGVIRVSAKKELAELFLTE